MSSELSDTMAKMDFLRKFASFVLLIYSGGEFFSFDVVQNVRNMKIKIFVFHSLETIEMNNFCDFHSLIPF